MKKPAYLAGFLSSVSGAFSGGLSGLGLCRAIFPSAALKRSSLSSHSRARAASMKETELLFFACRVFIAGGDIFVRFKVQFPLSGLVGNWDAADTNRSNAAQ